jgi:hypothetical protein
MQVFFSIERLAMSNMPGSIAMKGNEPTQLFPDFSGTTRSIVALTRSV